MTIQFAPVGTGLSAPSEAVLADLAAACPGGLRRGVPLAQVGRWRIGGPADALLDPSSPEQVAAAAALLTRSGTRWIVVGEGSNVLFDDAGFRGVVLRVGSALSAFRGDARTGIVRTEAGLWTPYFVLKTLRLGLAGCVHAVGVPGMIGGLVVMNGGSQRKGIGDQLLDVDVVEPDGALRTLDRAACGFAYRRSTLQESGAVVVSARFAYVPGDPSALRREAIAVMRDRKAKFPKSLPNCGSVFLSNPALYDTLGTPGRAIELTGLKGRARGGARISPLHANFIVNEGGARSEDVLFLVELVRRKVFARTGLPIDCEVRHLGPEGDFRPAHEASAELYANRIVE
jgi:UDP-N-acetylmuramate dehydrogenase